jgi:hypothetical protein
VEHGVQACLHCPQVITENRMQSEQIARVARIKAKPERSEAALEDQGTP